MTLSSDSSAYLSSLGRFGILPGLDRVRSVLELLGNPQRSYLTIQVVGTNGKGSTTAFIDAILRASGYRTGRYTSPHLFDVRERVVVSDRPISSEFFEGLFQELRHCLETRSLSLTFFEFLTVLAFMAFARASCQIVVLEAGMGGRWDATTACDPIATVLTQVALDHERVLGSGILNIFEEKVAVGRRGRPFIACLQDAVLRERFLERARERGFIPVLGDRDFSGEWIEPDRPDQKFRMAIYKGRWGERVLSSALTATYQIGNLSAALASLEWTSLPVSPTAILEGSASAANPGRLELLSRSPVILLDGAHNVSAIQALCIALRDRFGTSGKFGFFLAIHADKDWTTMLSALEPLSAAFFFPDDPLGDIESDSWVSSGEMKEYVGRSAGLSAFIRSGQRNALWNEAKEWANAERGRVLVVTGSLYLVGSLRSKLIPSPEPALFRHNERDLPGLAEP